MQGVVSGGLCLACKVKGTVSRGSNGMTSRQGRTGMLAQG